MMPKLMFYVQHLLGIGHVVRSMRIARALAGGGFEVTLVCGGPPVAGLDFGGLNMVQLPPVTTGANGFSELVDASGTPLTEADKAARRDILINHFNQIKPDILLLEAFPFGRRQMRFELLPLLDAAIARLRRPLIACSVRDILQQDRRPGRAEAYAELVERYFDLVLVHGDPNLAPFSASYPLADRIAGRLRHTGMVGPGETGDCPEKHDVIVSAGGGAVGLELIRAALAARPLCRLAAARWLVVTGPNAPDFARETATQGEPKADFRRFLPDLPARLKSARLSVSQAGYNTVADLLAARCPAVLVPYSEGGETEQTQRATLMQARGLARMVPENRLDAATMARAMDEAVGQGAVAGGIDLNGAQWTAEILMGAWRARQSRLE